jgi:hypothetical protein
MFFTPLLSEPSVAASVSVVHASGARTDAGDRGSIAQRVDKVKTPGGGRSLPAGTWGGEHVRLEATSQGAQLEFDCAHGSIKSPIRLDDRGQFEAAGEYLRESPGAIRIGHEPKSQPASYAGKVEGETMTLRVILTDTQQSLGEYSLEHGARARIVKCR